MNAAARLVCLILALWCCFFASAAHHSYGPQVDCSGYLKTPDRCTLEYFPICGSNGQTYINKCIFCSAVVAKRRKIYFKHYGNC